MTGTYVVSTETPFAPALSTDEAVLSVQAATGGVVRITEIGISFDAVTEGSVPALVRLLRQSDGGSGPTGVTPVQMDTTQDPAAAFGTYDFATNPTIADILQFWYVTVLGGTFVIQFAPGEEPIANSEEYIGIDVNLTSATNVVAYMRFYEV